MKLLVLIKIKIRLKNIMQKQWINQKIKEIKIKINIILIKKL